MVGFRSNYRLSWLIIALSIATPMWASSAEPPLITKVSTDDIVVQRDGRFTQTFHTEILLTNPAVAEQVGQQNIQYSEALTEVSIVEAYTLKSSGKKLFVDTNAIFPQLVPGNPGLAMFNDLKQKVIIFPDVSAGDTIVYTVTLRQKQAYFAGQFTSSVSYDRTHAVEQARVTITAPKTMPLFEETHDVGFEKQEKGANIVYQWHYSAPEPLVDDISAVSPWDRLPRFFISSFKDYNELGRAYAALATPKMAVTPAIQKLANEITAGTTDRRQQTKQLYEWVSTHIRYVSIALGDGAIVPHPADTVLTNGYGDCKDHSILFAALLKAKNIPAEPVLINLGNGYTVPTVPTLAPFNHLITWLPEFGIYADTTAGVAPFGLLAFEEYGKPVVHAVTTGDALRHVPVLEPGSATATVKVSKRFDGDGRMWEDSATKATGPFGVVMRKEARQIEAVGPERAAGNILKSHSIEGTGSFTYPALTELTPEFSVSSHYETPSRPRLVAGQGFAPASGLRLVSRPGDWLMGPLWQEKLKETEPTPCFSGNVVEDISIEMPADKHLVKLPAGTEIKTEHLQFNSKWSIDGQIVVVHREFASHMDQPLCDGPVRPATAQALAQIREDYRAQMAITGSEN